MRLKDINFPGMYMMKSYSIDYYQVELRYLTIPTILKIYEFDKRKNYITFYTRDATVHRKTLKIRRDIIYTL